MMYKVDSTAKATRHEKACRQKPVDNFPRDSGVLSFKYRPMRMVAGTCGAKKRRENMPDSPLKASTIERIKQRIVKPATRGMPLV